MLQTKVILWVDSSGIGPELRQCECRVIPLYYEPKVRPRRFELLTLRM
jgi:hypothetical protein